jgi:hypothetical protein
MSKGNSFSPTLLSKLEKNSDFPFDIAFKLFSALLFKKNKSKKQGARQLKDNRDIHKLTPF